MEAIDSETFCEYISELFCGGNVQQCNVILDNFFRYKVKIHFCVGFDHGRQGYEQVGRQTCCHAINKEVLFEIHLSLEGVVESKKFQKLLLQGLYIQLRLNFKIQWTTFW